jgi:hypothetical protein
MGHIERAFFIFRWNRSSGIDGRSRDNNRLFDKCYRRSLFFDNFFWSISISEDFLTSSIII